MNLLFPQNPMMRKLPEPIFEPEFDAATSLGFECLLFDEEALSSGDIDLALKRLPHGNGSELLYRGWILTEELYRRFQEALSARGYSLVSSAAQYAEVTYFPNYYPKIRDCLSECRLDRHPRFIPRLDAYLANWAMAPSSSKTTSSPPSIFGTKPVLFQRLWPGELRENCGEPEKGAREVSFSEALS